MLRALGFSRATERHGASAAPPAATAAATAAEAHPRPQPSASEPQDSSVPPEATAELPTRADIAAAKSVKPALLQLARLTDQQKRAEAIKGRWKTGVQIQLQPDSEGFRRREAFFRRLLSDPSWSVDGILTEFFTAHEKRLFVPADPRREPLLHKIQGVNRRRFAALLSRGDPQGQQPPGPFAGQRADLAFKFTMLYFGLPTEPMVFNANAWRPAQGDESDWDDLESEPEFVPEEPLRFLNKHMDRTWGKDILRGEGPDSSLEMYYKMPKLLAAGQSYDRPPLMNRNTHEPEKFFGTVAVGLRGGGSFGEVVLGPGDEDTEMADLDDSNSDSDSAKSLHLGGGDGFVAVGRSGVGGAGGPARPTVLYGLQGRVQIDMASPEAFYGGVDALLGLVRRQGVHVHFRLYDTKAKKTHSSEDVKLGSPRGDGDPAEELRFWERFRAKLELPGAEHLAIVVVLRQQRMVLDRYGDDLPLTPDEGDKYIVEFTLDGGEPANVAYLCMPISVRAAAAVATPDYRAWFRTIVRILHCEPARVGASRVRTEIAAFFGMSPNRHAAASYGGEYWPRTLWDQVVARNMKSSTPQKRLKLWRSSVVLGTPTSCVLRIADYPKSPHDPEGVAVVNKDPEAVIDLLQEYLVTQDYFVAESVELTIHPVGDPDSAVQINVPHPISSAEREEQFKRVRGHCTGCTVVTARPVWGTYVAHGPEAQPGSPPPDGAFMFQPSVSLADFKRHVRTRWLRRDGIDDLQADTKTLRIEQRPTDRQVQDIASEGAAEAPDEKVKAANLDRVKRMVSNAAAVDIDEHFGEAQWDEFKQALSQRRLYVHAVSSRSRPVPYTWGYHDAEAAGTGTQEQRLVPGGRAASEAALPSTTTAPVLSSASKPSTPAAANAAAPQPAAEHPGPSAAPPTGGAGGFPREQPIPLPRGEPGWLYTQPLGPHRITTENERAQRLREYSYAHPLHIHNEGQGEQIPINAPPIEHLQRVPSDNVPAVEAQVLTPSEQARLQTWVADFRNLALSRAVRCPYRGCWVFLPVDDENRWERHLAQKHQAEKCNFCDEPLFRYWTPQQQAAHFLAKHGELFSAKADASRDNTVVMRSLHRVDPREERYHFCPRCGRDHSVLTAPADRTQHDNQCYPGLDGVSAWCQDCGERVDKSDLVTNLISNTRRHQCEKPLKELAAERGHPFCTDCGLPLGVLSPTYARKHRLFCKGASTAEHRFCPWCGVDVGRDRAIKTKHEESCSRRPLGASGPFELNARSRYAVAGLPDPLSRDPTVKSDSPRAGYILGATARAPRPEGSNSKGGHGEETAELRLWAWHAGARSRLGDHRKQEQLVDRSMGKRMMAHLKEKLREAGVTNKGSTMAPSEQAAPVETHAPVVVKTEEVGRISDVNIQKLPAAPVKETATKAPSAAKAPVVKPATPPTTAGKKAATGSKTAPAKPRSRKRARADSDDEFRGTSSSDASSSEHGDDGEDDTPANRAKRARRRKRGEKDPTFRAPRKQSEDGEDDETKRARLESDELPLPGGLKLVLPAEQ